MVLVGAVNSGPSSTSMTVISSGMEFQLAVVPLSSGALRAIISSFTFRDFSKSKNWRNRKGQIVNLNELSALQATTFQNIWILCHIMLLKKGLTFETYRSPSFVWGSVSILKFLFSFPLMIWNFEIQFGVLIKSLSSTGIRRTSFSFSFSLTLAVYYKKRGKNLKPDKLSLV